jgi:autotransporter-associated beta strand protein
VGGTPTLLEFSSRFRFFSPARAAALALALLAAPALLLNHASAATYTWDGGGANTSWATAANWNADTTPIFNNTADIVISGITKNQNFISANRTIRSLTFDASNDILTQIALSSAFTSVATSRHLTFSADSGNATLTVDADSTGNKEILRTGVLFSDVNLTSSLDIVHNGAGALIFGSQTIIKGAGGITKSGTGTLIISGSNTYTGTTTISAGALQLGNVNALQNTTLDTGTSGSQAVTFSVAGANTYNIGAIQGGDELAFGNNTISVGSNNATTSFTGTLAGSGGSLTKAGTGTLTLSGANTYDGTTTISAGTIQIDHANGLGSGGNITFSGGGLKYGTTVTTDLSSRIKNSGSAILVDTNGESVTWGTAVDSTNSGGLTKNGTGTLTLSATNTYTGTTAISAGTLTLSGGSAIADNGAVTLANATSTALNVDSSETIGNLSGGGSLGGNIAIASGQTLTVNQTTNLSYNGSISGAGGLTINGTHQLQLMGNNSFTGMTTINNGTLRLQGPATNTTIVGDITINGGSLLWGSTMSNQVADTSSVTLTNGSLELSTAADTIASINMSGGTLRRAGAALTLNSASSFTGGSLEFTATTSRINTTGTTTLGNVTFDLSSASITNSDQLRLGGDIIVNANTTANFTNSGGGMGQLGLNGANRTINVGTGAAMNVGWSIAGTSVGLTKNGSGTLTLNGTNTYTGGFTLNDGKLNINSATALGNATVGTFIINGGTIDNTSAGTVTVGAKPLTINSDFTYVGGSQSLSLGTGATTLGTAAGTSRTITVSGNSLTIGGIIADGTTANSIIKEGDGSLILSGINTFGGGVVLNAGALLVNGATNVFGTGNLTLNSGTLSSFGSSTARTVTNNATVAGNVVFGDSANTAQLTMSGVISGGPSATLTKNGTGLLVLSGANTFNGSIVINSGTIRLDSSFSGNTFAGNIVNDGTLNYNTAGQPATYLELTGNISGTGNIIQSQNQGILILSGSNTFSGGVDHNGGALRIASSTALGTGTYTIANATVMSFNNTSGGSLVNTNNNAMVLGGNTTFTGTNSYDFGTGAVTISGGSRQIAVTANTLTLGGAISDGGNAYQLTKAGAGTLVLGGANTFSGGLVLSAGTLAINNASALGAGAFTIAAGAIDNTSGSVNTNSQDNAMNWNSNFTFVGTNDLNLGAGAVTMDASRTITVSASNLTVGGAISGSGFSLTKNGTGTLALGGANTFSGGVVLNLGTLAINNAAALGTGTFTISAASTIDNTSGVAVTNSQNNAISWNANLTFAGSNDLNLGTGAVTMSAARAVTVTAGNLTIGGEVAGGFGLTKNGSGTLILSGNNSYTGGTTINNGTLLIAGAGLLGQGNYSTTIANSGMFRFSGSNNQTLSGVISGTGNLIHNGAGTLFLTATNTFSGNLAVEQGTLSIATINNASANGALGNSSNAVTLGSAGNTGTLSYTGSTASSSKAFTMGTDGTGSFEITDGATALTVSGIVNGSGNLEKSGSGRLILIGANSYSGNTTISAGTLQIGAGTDAGALGTGPAITNNGALLFNVGSGNRTIAADMSGTGSLTKNGTGALTLSGSNSYNGTTTVNAGSLLVTGSTASSAITINSGATLGGSGTVGALVINSGATLSPGNSPGTITLGNTSWEGGGNYNWQIYDASGVAGTGWDLVNSAGTLTINSTSGNKFNINLWSLSGISPDASGTPTGFVASNNYSWTIASFASVTGFDAANFAINTSATNGTGGFSGFTGTFSLALSGGNITIDYAAPNNSAIWTGGTGNWSTGANWQSNSAPANGSPIDFSGSGGTSTNNSQLTSVTGLTFTANATGSYTVNGSALDIGAIGVANDSSYEQTVSTNLTMTAAQSFAATGANLTVSGAVNNGGYALTFSGNNSGTLSGVVSGNGSLVKSGTGTLTISGSNTYSGGTTINAGTIQIRNAAALGSSGTISFGGGTLQWGNVTTDLSSRFSTAGGQDFNIDTGANLVTFNTALSNSGGTLTKNGSGTLQFAAANTLSSIVLNSGTLRGGNSANTFGGSSALITLNGGQLRFASNFNTYGNNILVQSNSTIHNIASTGGVVALITFGNLTLSNSTLTVTSNNASLAGNILFNGTTTLSEDTILNVGTSGNNSLTLRDISETGGAHSLTKTGVGTLTINGSAAYTGTTTVSAGVLKIGSGGSTGSLASSTIVNDGEILVDRTGSITLAANMSGSGALTKNSNGTLTLTGNSSYSGGTTLNTGTIVIGHANAAGSGTITQTDATSLLKIDTTGTITNDMSVHNVLATQSATLSGAITVNNATWDIETGDTLTISGDISGTGGITKNGTGTLVLSGSNTYSAPTVINAGTLEAASDGALGSNNTVQVHGGTLLVTADDAINGKNIELGGSGVGLRFSGNYSGAIGNLTLSANSIIDLGPDSVRIMIQGLTLTNPNHTLSFYNWSGLTLWNGGTGNDTDRVYFGPDLSDEALAKIYFYSGPGDSFLGSGFDLGLKATGFDPAMGDQIIPVPEPETYATGLLLLLGGAVWMWKRNRKFEA